MLPGNRGCWPLIGQDRQSAVPPTPTWTQESIGSFTGHRDSGLHFLSRCHLTLINQGCFCDFWTSIFGTELDGETALHPSPSPCVCYKNPQTVADIMSRRVPDTRSAINALGSPTAKYESCQSPLEEQFTSCSLKEHVEPFHAGDNVTLYSSK